MLYYLSTLFRCCQLCSFLYRLLPLRSLHKIPHRFYTFFIGGLTNSRPMNLLFKIGTIDQLLQLIGRKSVCATTLKFLSYYLSRNCIRMSRKTSTSLGLDRSLHIGVRLGINRDFFLCLTRSSCFTRPSFLP